MSIANFYQTMKNDKSLEQGLKTYGINYQDILYEECQSALRKYLNKDLYKL